MTAESIPGEYYPKLFKKPNNKQKPNGKSPKGPNLLKKSLGVPRSTRNVFAIIGEDEPVQGWGSDQKDLSRGWGVWGPTSGNKARGDGGN